MENYCVKFFVNKGQLKTNIMKTNQAKKHVSLRSIEKELKMILEDDIRKLNAPQYVNHKFAAFLQLIAV